MLGLEQHTHLQAKGIPLCWIFRSIEIAPQNTFHMNALTPNKVSPFLLRTAIAEHTYHILWDAKVVRADKVHTNSSSLCSNFPFLVANFFFVFFTYKTYILSIKSLYCPNIINEFFKGLFAQIFPYHKYIYTYRSDLIFLNN